MRFEIRYSSGERHEVALEGTLATVGRDPSSDLILNDVKCSRRHAVLEAGPQGLAIRDAGSANGVYVNGARVERMALQDGDVVRLGDIEIRVLPEPVSGTVSMEPADQPTVVRAPGWKPPPPPVPPTSALGSPHFAPAPRPPRPVSIDDHPLERTPTPSSITAGPLPGKRSVMVMTLAILWVLSIPVYLAGGGLAGYQLRGPLRWAGASIGVALAALSTVMAFGLTSRARWSRASQLVIAGLGIFLCPFAPASITILVYLLRPVAEAQFTSPKGLAPRDPSDGLFAAFLLGTVLLGAVLTGGAVFFLFYAAKPLP